MNPQRESFNGMERQGGIGDVLHDVTTLVELQTRLLFTDAKQASRQTGASLVAFAIGVCLFLGSIPVVLYGVSEWLTTITDFSLFQALFAIGGATILIGIVSVLVGILGIRRGFNHFGRSREELSCNLESIKQSLKRKRTGQF